jgi:hypothetical protein
MGVMGMLCGCYGLRLADADDDERCPCKLERSRITRKKIGIS